MKYAGQTGGITDCALIAGQQRSLYEDRKTTVGIPRNTATSAATLLCAAMRTGNGGVLPLSLLNHKRRLTMPTRCRHLANLISDKACPECGACLYCRLIPCECKDK